MSITIADETLFWKTWFERGVVFVQDILDDYGNFLSLEEFKSKFNININYLHYFQLIAAIPSYLKKRAAQTAVPQYVFSSTLASLPDGNSIDLAEMRCKKYYQLLNECGSIVPSGVRKWEERYPEYFTDWREKFRAIYKLTRDNKLRQFCFRLLQRITVTKRELKRFNLASDDKCTFCSNPDSIEHTFIDCTVSISFYTHALVWFNQCHGTTVSL